MYRQGGISCADMLLARQITHYDQRFTKLAPLQPTHVHIMNSPAAFKALKGLHMSLTYWHHCNLELICMCMIDAAIESKQCSMKLVYTCVRTHVPAHSLSAHLPLGCSANFAPQLACCLPLHHARQLSSCQMLQQALYRPMLIDHLHGGQHGLAWIR